VYTYFQIKLIYVFLASSLLVPRRLFAKSCALVLLLRRSMLVNTLARSAVALGRRVRLGLLAPSSPRIVVRLALSLAATFVYSSLAQLRAPTSSRLLRSLRVGSGGVPRVWLAPPAVVAIAFALLSAVLGRHSQRPRHVCADLKGQLLSIVRLAVLPAEFCLDSTCILNYP